MLLNLSESFNYYLSVAKSFALIFTVFNNIIISKDLISHSIMYTIPRTSWYYVNYGTCNSIK